MGGPIGEHCSFFVEKFSWQERYSVPYGAMPIMYSTPMATRTTNVEMMKPCSMGFAPEPVVYCWRKVRSERAAGGAAKAIAVHGGAAGAAALLVGRVVDLHTVGVGVVVHLHPQL